MTDLRWQVTEVTHRRVIVYGASDQGRVDYQILKRLSCKIEAFVDDTPGMQSPVPGIPICEGIRGIEAFLKTSCMADLGFVVAIGNPYGHIRRKLHGLLKGIGLFPVSFSDPTALICSTAEYGAGLQTMAAAIVNSYVRMGEQCLVNTRALVEHDCVLESGVEIGPGAVLCGRVHVMEDSWIGANATVRPRVSIGANSIVGAGAVVVSDIPDNAVAVGVPARVIRENNRK